MIGKLGYPSILLNNLTVLIMDIPSSPRCFRRFWAESIFVIVLIFSHQHLLHAAEIPNTAGFIDLNAREQSVAEFVDALFREIDIPLVTHEDLSGIVNGRFEGTVKNVLEQVTSTFDIIIYFDGAVAHAFPSNQMVRKLMPVSRTISKRTLGFAQRSDLLDKHNQLVEEDGALLITGVPRFVEQIGEIIELLNNTPTTVKKESTQNVGKVESLTSEPLTYRVFQLKHAWAEDTSYTVGGQSIFVPGVASLLRELSSEGEIAGESIISTNSDKQSSIDTPIKNNGLRGSGLTTSKVVPVTKHAEAQSLHRSNSPVRIVADTRQNSIIISDTLPRMWIYEALIEKLDKPSEMVEIEATIIDINSEKSQELGINWNVESSDAEVSFDEGSSVPETSQGRGGVLSFALGEQAEFLARIRALEQRGAARVISKPHIVTLSNVEGILGSTSEFFVRIAGNEEVDLFNVPVGTTLRVKPHVFYSGNTNHIKLFVSIEDGAQSSTIQVDGVPVVERSTINTQAIIGNGDSLLVGGLARESFSRNEIRVPFLGRVPVLGRLFRSTQNSATRVERLFMITPRLASQGKFMARAETPLLQGKPSEFISNSRRNFEHITWPSAETQPLWPDRIKGYDPKESRKSPKKFVSPFGVKIWSHNDSAGV